MKSTYLLLLASLTCGNLTGSSWGQGAPATEDGMLDHRTIDDIILQKAETTLLRYILEKIGEDGDTNDGVSSQSDCVTKRQHPGKRLTAEEEEQEQPEKRQHPGRREEEEQQQQEQKEGDPEDQEEDSEYEAVQKRQHPGRRRAVGLQGHGQQVNRFPGTPPVMLLMSELSKRQHPGKRFLAFFSKRQHPGKRDAGDKGELEEEQEEEEQEEEEEEQEQGALQLQQQFDKRQHPGKRFWENSGPDSGSSRSSNSRLCDGLETSSSSSSPGCSIRTSLLLDLLHHVAQEKRQHPGKRLAPSPEEEDLVEKK